MSEQLTLSVLYYSATGTNHALAEAAARTAEREGAAVRLRRVLELAPDEAVRANPAWSRHREATRHIAEATMDDLKAADCLLFSVPTRFGGIPAQMKQFLDQAGPLWAQGELANKAVSAMSSAQNLHGGQEATLLALYTVMWHWGAIVVAPGYTHPAYFAAGGNPYGVSTVAVENGQLAEETVAAVEAQTRRLLQVGGWIRAGLKAHTMA
jgi:NAD(P)H dehydrogenase (quinone)